MKENIIQSAGSMGLPTNLDMNTIFNQMGQMVNTMKQQLDNEEPKS